jgi:hypothetical protein
VPSPTLEFVAEDVSDEIQGLTASVFIAFVNLTDVLDQHLQHIYHVDKQHKPLLSTSSLELSLNNWVDSLTGDVRLVIIRGTHIDIPGAASLRLAYLSARLLMQRLELEADRNGPGGTISGTPLGIRDEQGLLNRRAHARRTCEDILILTQELQPRHLGDFWVPISAFAYPTTVSFLLRCAVEAEMATGGQERVAESFSFRIARDLIEALRGHRERQGWDLGDICLAQHGDFVEMVLQGGGVSGSHQLQADAHTDTARAADVILPDASIVDHLFPGLWEPLQNFW